MNNPLLQQAELPPFQKIRPEHAFPALELIIKENRAALGELLKGAEFSWESLMVPMEIMSERLSDMWSPVGHLNSVTNTEEWRDAYNQCLPLLTEYSTEIGQNKALYAAIQYIKDHQYDQLDSVQKKIIDDELRDFKLAGVALEGEEKKRYVTIQKKLSELTTKFEENVLDATQHWFFHTEDKAQLSGLPEYIFEFAKTTAKQKEKSGYVLTLDFPCYIAVMKYAESRELRKAFYTAFATRASDQGPDAGKFDNSELMVELLQLRQEKARLVGYANYAEYSLVTKMAQSPEQVLTFLRDLAKRSRKFAEKDLAELNDFAKEQLQLDDFSAWDMAYASEKLQQEKYALNEDMLRPYFPVDKVFSGMFEVIKKIYGMRVVEISGIETWDETVRFFEIFDEEGQLRGKFYADLYARPQKRGGAWMDDCRNRFVHNGKVNIPVAYLVCNFNNPIGDQPALLTHSDVVTLFHEFGHGLHHMLTKVDYSSASGINGVSWDAVELPSQFMENFCWERESIPFFSEHYETREALPQKWFDSMLAAKNFQSGLAMLRQLEFSLFDFLLHQQEAPKNALEIQHLLNQVREEICVVDVPKFNRFQHSFSHIFAGGYAAGYYSYKWAEVLSSDAFSKFEEHGIVDQKTGKEFLTAVLEKGSSAEAMDLFVAFRGRKPKVDALLRHSGLS